MRVLYYDLFCGISGDMNLGAMIDLGVEPEYLKRELSKLNIDEEFKLEIKRDSKQGISGTKVDVVLENSKPHHHDHEHGHHHHDHEHDHHHHDHDHEHDHHHHDHDHEHDHHDHDHEHDHHHHDHGHGHGHTHSHDRNYEVIRTMIESSNLSDSVKALSIKMFYEIAVAEAKVHGKSVEEVHFHEVGAVDSIVDIVGAAICFDALGVDLVMASPVQVGGGFVMCDHGKMPVPAPATAEILKEVPFRTGLVQKETTTPTGAAIIKVLAGSFTENPNMIIEKTGYGLGTRNLEVPNVTRVYLGHLETQSEKSYESIEKTGQYLLETNIDDMNAELFGHVEMRLFEAGALDVFKTPIIMKKGRPAVKLSVLIREEDRDAVLDIIFLETTSGGVREFAVTKHMMKKKYRMVETEYGAVQVKDFYHKGKCLKSKAEYEDCARLAREHKVSIKAIYDAVQSADQ